jgi:ABC-type amino acid transport substrate-binding protein
MLNCLFRLCQALLVSSLLCSWAEAGFTPEQQAWLKWHRQFHYAPEENNGPFVFIDQNEQPQGLSVELLQLIGKKTGFQFVPTSAHTLNENLERMENVEVDVTTTLQATAEREQYLAFTEPYIRVPVVLMVGTHYSHQTRLADMAGKRVMVDHNEELEEYVREHFKQIHWVVADSTPEALRQLSNGTVDGVVADLASVHFILNQQSLAGIQAATPIGYDYQYRFAYRKDWPLLGQILQQGMQAISTEEREALLARWMPLDSSPGWREQLRWLILLTPLLLGLIYMSGDMLRRHARKKAARQSNE